MYFSDRTRTPDILLRLSGLNIPFANSLKYLGVIFDKGTTWKLHKEIIEAKVFGKFIKLYSLFKSEKLNTNFKLTLPEALIRSVMTYVCPA
jgi:hypothetical protein